MVTVAGGQLAVYQGASEAPKLTFTRQMNVRSISPHMCLNLDRLGLTRYIHMAHSYQTNPKLDDIPTSIRHARPNGRTRVLQSQLASAGRRVVAGGHAF